jgi:hypothetical protein
VDDVPPNMLRDLLLEACDELGIKPGDYLLIQRDGAHPAASELRPSHEP